MFKQNFFSFEQVRDALGTTDEWLRQALVSGALPAYLELKQDSAVFVSASDRSEKTLENGTGPNCSWVRNLFLSESPIYALSGWFRVDPEFLSQSARFGNFRDSAKVIAPTGCDDFFSDGDYFDFFICTHENCLNPLIMLDALKYEPQLKDLWFDAATLDSLTSDLSQTTLSADGEAHGGLPDSADIHNAKPMKLRSDREETLLRVIAGLWSLSDLPREHNTAANELSYLFDSWGWDKPRKSTIADVVLKQALNLPGAKIRKSD